MAMERTAARVGVGLAIALVAGGAPAGAQPTRSGPPQHARVRLVAPTGALQPGETNYLGLLFDIDDGWHIYWDGVNDSGFAPTVTWTAPSGMEPGPILWHAPHRHIAPGDILDHIYEGQTLLLVPVDIPTDATPGELLTFRAQVDWLVCREVCLPGNADLRITLPIAPPGADVLPTEFADVFAASLARVPAPWVEGESALKIRVSRGTIEVDAPEARTVSYYPQSEAARADDLLHRGQSTEQRLRLRLAPSDRGAVAADPVIRFVIEAEYPGEESPVCVLVERPLSELGG